MLDSRVCLRLKECDMGLHASRERHESSAADPHTIEVSIIIPIGPGDESWQNLLQDVSNLPFTAEILCVATEPRTNLQRPNSQALPSHLEWIVTAPGRAHQLNAGASRARGRFLWFLHADSRITGAGLRALARALAEHPQALHYFNLRFAADGPWLMRLNACGVWWRSHALGMPFGDQGFCLEQALFDSLGGYPETAPYGEDHLLVWTARRRGVRLNCTGEILLTSARKYRDRGWCRTTVRYLWLTLRQAWPQFVLWLRGL